MLISCRIFHSFLIALTWLICWCSVSTIFACLSCLENIEEFSEFERTAQRWIGERCSNRNQPEAITAFKRQYICIYPLNPQTLQIKAKDLEFNNKNLHKIHEWSRENYSFAKHEHTTALADTWIEHQFYRERVSRFSLERAGGSSVSNMGHNPRWSHWFVRCHFS